MSRKQNRVAKLIAAVGLFGVAIIFSAPMVRAQVSSFSAANYKGRYACELSFDEDFFTAVYKYGPDGAGGYQSGTMIGTLNNFAVFDNTAPSGQFCTYFLLPASSAYTVGSNGLGFETLSWTPSATNNASCPGAFIDQTAVALRNLLDANGGSIRAEVADRNLFGIDASGDAGHGQCLR